MQNYANEIFMLLGAALVLVVFVALFKVLEAMMRVHECKFEEGNKVQIFFRPLRLLRLRPVDETAKRAKHRAIAWLIAFVVVALVTSNYFQWYAREIRSKESTDLIIK